MILLQGRMLVINIFISLTSLFPWWVTIFFDSRTRATIPYQTSVLIALGKMTQVPSWRKETTSSLGGVKSLWYILQ